jgi:hypothetical protein
MTRFETLLNLKLSKNRLISIVFETLEPGEARSTVVKKRRVGIKERPR